MRTGFDYRDKSKANWTADIEWSFLRRDGGADVYRIQWALNGSPVAQSAELSFDGKVPANLRLTDQLFISIEPMPSTTKTRGALTVTAGTYRVICGLLFMNMRSQ
jgi:hypothetical protein